MCVTFSYFYPFPTSRKLSATGGIRLNLSEESLVLTLIYEAILVEEKQTGLAEIDLPVDMIYIPVKSFSICIVLISIAIVTLMVRFILLFSYRSSKNLEKCLLKRV